MEKEIPVFQFKPLQHIHFSPSTPLTANLLFPCYQRDKCRKILLHSFH
uniref:Uncharacterized protein n=1 Tax=Arundo donax TaxID=35708 RepID=A0A0A8ZSH6_ARUDO